MVHYTLHVIYCLLLTSYSTLHKTNSTFTTLLYTIWNCTIYGTHQPGWIFWSLFLQLWALITPSLPKDWSKSRYSVIPSWRVESEYIFQLGHRYKYVCQFVCVPHDRKIDRQTYRHTYICDRVEIYILTLLFKVESKNILIFISLLVKRV